MKVTIHRGAKEIGGNCVELQSNEFRLILDLGLPLPEVADEKIPSSKTALSEPLIQGLLNDRSRRLLSDIPGLLDESGPVNQAVLLSHSHLDHCGLIDFLPARIPIFATPATQTLINVGNMFRRATRHSPHFSNMPLKKVTRVGPFNITPWPVPHSAPDATALEIEVEGKRILYSGDFRAGGRKGYLLKNLFRQIQGLPDILILEGTMIGRDGGFQATENWVEHSLADVFDGSKNLSLIVFSTQNLDRCISIFKASRRARKTFVVDLYAAYVLRALASHFPHIPQMEWSGIRVLFTKDQVEKLLRNGHEQFLRDATRRQIHLSAMLGVPRRYCLLTRSNRSFPALISQFSNKPDIRVIWSLWDGYWKDDLFLKPFCEAQHIQPAMIHSGGHASLNDLRDYVQALKPRMIFPIHTSKPGDFLRLFSQAQLLDDGLAREI